MEVKGCPCLTVHFYQFNTYLLFECLNQRPYNETRLAEVIKKNDNVTPCKTGIFLMLQDISVATKLYRK